MMPGPHTWGRDGVGSSEGGKRFPFLRASLFSLSFLVSLSNPYSSFYLFCFFCWFLLLCYHACHVNADDMQSTFYQS